MQPVRSAKLHKVRKHMRCEKYNNNKEIMQDVLKVTNYIKCYCGSFSNRN